MINIVYTYFSGLVMKFQQHQALFGILAIGSPMSSIFTLYLSLWSSNPSWFDSEIHVLPRSLWNKCRESIQRHINFPRLDGG